MSDTAQPASSAIQVEMAGADIIAETDRKGKPSGLFWPWFAANISVFGICNGAFVLGFGISFAQAAIAGTIGIVFSFLLCGLVAMAGKRGSAPTMVLSRAAMGVNGNRIASIISWILTVGWETVLTAMATMATATVFKELGWGDGNVIKIIGLVVVAVLIVGGGIIGFDMIMKMQTVITIVTAVLTVGYVALVFNKVDLGALTAIPAGSFEMVIGAGILAMTAFGLGWVNAAADYSRYLPRKASTGGVVFWTTFGAAAPVVLLVFFGILLTGSDAKLAEAMNAYDPIGALSAVLPTWYLVPFMLVAVLGLVGGAVMDIYSSGLALVAAGLPVKRPVAAAIDGTIMIAGTIYIVFGPDSFFTVFQGFLITLGVPIAAWAGIMLADVLMRRKDYDEIDLFDSKGRYGSWPAAPLVIIGVAAVVGWGLVVNSYASWLNWQGYFMGILGGKDGGWAYANLGVVVALAIGFLGTWVFRRGAVRRQEARPARVVGESA
ncbi:MAG: cytosine permease [Propionibacteriaceae bacterium]|jgi:purine-cytosine permease-like protein|nr:cytosine permease [Propionibacteriaceae bacterium]